MDSYYNLRLTEDYVDHGFVGDIDNGDGTLGTETVFDEDGLQTFQMSAPIMLENTDKTGEAVQVLPFEKIADAVENRFESMITDQHYTVKKAKMVLRTYNDENQKLSAEVVWHLTVTDDKGNIQILMYDALTGKEIFLT